MGKTNESSSFGGIDLMKFVLAIFVIGIHAGAEVGDRMNDVLWYVASFAVSCFFIASGFSF